MVGALVETLSKFIDGPRFQVRPPVNTFDPGGGIVGSIGGGGSLGKAFDPLIGGVEVAVVQGDGEEVHGAVEGLSPGA